ncbi:MAG: TIGR04149 family rSAM-modified RiPP [Tannerellaceae bacterium]|nr:TIGR04149 family rSAM-modified RiPP [Tannerellaceae bacterium]
MKQLSKLKLNIVSKAELEKREMNLLVGGECCGCGCNGSSSTDSNAHANYEHGYSELYGGAKWCWIHGGTSWTSNC